MNCFFCNSDDIEWLDSLEKYRCYQCLKEFVWLKEEAKREFCGEKATHKVGKKQTMRIVCNKHKNEIVRLEIAIITEFDSFFMIKELKKTSGFDPLCSSVIEIN